MDKFIIKCRYEYISDGGKQFTDWFVWDGNPHTEKDCNDKIVFAKEAFGYIDKKTHLRHEYKLVSFDEFKNETNEIMKRIKEGQKRDKKYYASEQWKELKHKKYIARKERKQHQEEYLKMIEETKED